MAFLSHDGLLDFMQSKKYFGVYVIDAQSGAAYHLGLFARKEDAEKYLDILKGQYGEDTHCDPEDQAKWIEEIFGIRTEKFIPLPLKRSLPDLLEIGDEEIEEEIYSYMEDFNTEGICLYDAAADSETLHIYELAFDWANGFSRHWSSHESQR